MSTPKTPKIESIELSTLVQDITLSGRTEKEIADNAKQLRPIMEAEGGWSPDQPGSYCKRGKEKVLVAGFTRTRAAIDAGITHGYFVEVPDDATKLRTVCIRTNEGRQISPYKQGELYAAMRDGTNPENAEAGDTIFEPMKTDAIAKEVGKSRQWVETCISVFENPPEVGELVQSGQVAPGAVVKAKQWLGDERKAKLLPFLKAAIKSAHSEGKETATQKHLEAHRADFAPLKAATTEKAKPSASTPVQELHEVTPEEQRASEGMVDTSAQDAIDREEDERPSATSPVSAPSELDLGSSSASTPAPERRRNKLIADYTEAVRTWAKEQQIANWDEEDVALLVGRLVAIQLPF